VSYVGTDDAVLVASRGVASVRVEEYAPLRGHYYVTFQNPVDECGWTVSVNPFYGGPPGGFGETLVGLDWDNTLPPQDQTPNPYVLRVTMTDSNGDPLLSPGSLADTITVVAHC
jgi:hypothetical protein